MDLKLELLQEKEIMYVATLLKKAAILMSIKEIENRINTSIYDKSTTLIAKTEEDSTIKGAYFLEDIKENETNLFMPCGWMGCYPTRKDTGTYIMKGLQKIFSQVAYYKNKELQHILITYKSKNFFEKFGYDILGPKYGIVEMEKIYIPKKANLTQSENKIVDKLISQIQS